MNKRLATALLRKALAENDGLRSELEKFRCTLEIPKEFPCTEMLGISDTSEVTLLVVKPMLSAGTAFSGLKEKSGVVPRKI